MDVVAAIWPCDLEVRADRRKLRGSFPYNREATVRDRGKVRKERFKSGAFGWQMRRFQELQEELAQVIKKAVNDARRALLERELAARNVDLLRGHNFDRPLASMLAGSLKVKDTSAALQFEANLPENAPSWVDDTMKAVDAGLLRGVSPGFAVPPASAVANAEELVEEPGNPGVQVRQINQAVLYELSLVTRPAYCESEVDLRDDFLLPSVPVADDWEVARWL
ncbi:MAG: HK97 family phage prohead protease [Rhodospirillales bacterium]|nr:HK97 family phage prohead protease [Rhodospirillales bacterium]